MKHRYSKTGLGVLAATLLGGGIMTAAYTRIPVSGDPGEHISTRELKTRMIKRKATGDATHSRVRPSGEGRYAFTPSRFSLPHVTDPAKIRRTPPKGLRPSGPRGTLYGNVASFTGIVNVDQAYWGEINTSTGEVTPIFNGADLMNPTDYDIQTGAVRDGILYTPTYSEDLINGVSVMWRRRDLRTGDVLPPINFGGNDAAFAYSMTYDPGQDLFHCLALDARTASFGLYITVDPKTWNVFAYSNINSRGFLGAIAYNPADGQIYAISDANEIMTIDAYGNGLTTVGYLDDYFSPVDNGRTTPMVYSPMDGSFVLSYIDYDDQHMKLLYIDALTMEMTEGATLYPNNPYLTCLWTPDAYAVDEAPAMPALPAFLFEGASTEGAVRLAVPAETYAGVTLDAGVDVEMTLDIDGVELYNGLNKAGSTFDIPCTLPEGVHTYTVVCAIDGQKSPERAGKFHVGYDVPATPSGLEIYNHVLSWEPVTRGANGGFFEADKVEYEVSVNGDVLTPEPIKETSLLLPSDGELMVGDFEVIAYCNDRVSEPGKLRGPIGQSLNLPWSMSPKADEAPLYTVLDANNDGNCFQYQMSESTGEYYFTLFLGNLDMGDDWLFLPATIFDDENVLYSLGFTYAATMPYDDLENLEVKIGRSPKPDAMERTIYSHSNLQVWGEKLITPIFPVPETGEWYIGFHCTTDGAVGGGVRLNNFSLRSLADRSSAAPADPQVRLVPAPKGALQVTARITAPTLDLMGRSLDATDEVSFTVRAGDNTAVAKSLPGEVCEATVDVPRSGYNDVEIEPSNAAGIGLNRTHNAYIGLDAPLPPANIKGIPSDDNLSLMLTWDKVSETGVHGGYVDPDNVRYSIVTLTGITVNEIGSTKDTQYTFVPYTTNLDRYIVGPRAVNEMGASTYTQFGSEVLGRPWPVPVKEYFGGIFNYEPLSYTTVYPFTNSLWEPTSSIMTLGTGARVDCERGAMMVANLGYTPTQGELILPKAKTTGAEACVFQMRWLDWSHTPGFSVWGRCAGCPDLVEIASFMPSYPKEAEWRDEEVKLPASFNDCGWVEIRIRAELSTDYDEMGFIDSYQITQNVEYDLKLASIDAPGALSVGETGQALVTVLNAGTEIISGTLKVEMTDGNGTPISETYTPVSRLVPAQQFLTYVDVEALREYLDSGKIILTATVSATDDEVTHNDSMSTEIQVNSGIAPSVGDLTAEWVDINEEDAVLLKWSEPSMTYGGYDSFEFIEPFAVTEEMGMWRNLDLDKRDPFRIAGLDWPHDREPVAWQPIDAEYLGIMQDDRLCPHSGTMYLMARSISVDIDAGEEPVQSNDWLISPEVIGGTQVTFWYGTVTPAYPEYVELWVSSTDNNPESFQKQRTFSKSGDESWEEVRVMLPEDARYFALVYRSYDSLGAMIDDIAFTPARLETWQLDHYSVLRSVAGNAPAQIGTVSDVTCWTDDLTDLQGADASELTYHVRTAVKTAGSFREGPLSNAARLRYSSVDDIRQLEGISGGRGVIIAEGLGGETLSVYATDGKHLLSVNLTSDRERVAVEPGVYVVKCGNAMGKIYVK